MLELARDSIVEHHLKKLAEQEQGIIPVNGSLDGLKIRRLQ